MFLCPALACTNSLVVGVGKSGGESYGGDVRQTSEKKVLVSLTDLSLSYRRLERGIGIDLIDRAIGPVKLPEAELFELNHLLPLQRSLAATLLLHPSMKNALDVLFADLTRLAADFHPTKGPLRVQSPEGEIEVMFRYNFDTNEVEYDVDKVFAASSDDVEHAVAHELVHKANLETEVSLTPTQSIRGHMRDYFSIDGVFAFSDGGSRLANAIAAVWTQHAIATRDDWMKGAVIATVRADKSTVRVLNEHLVELCQFSVNTGGDKYPNVAVVGFAKNGAQRIAIAPEGKGNTVRFFDYDVENGCRAAEGSLATLVPYAGLWDGGVRISATRVNGEPVITTGAGPGGGSHVRSFSEINGEWQEISPGFFADPASSGGVHVGVGMSGGQAVIAAELGNRIRIFNLASGTILKELNPVYAFPANPIVKIAFSNGDFSVTPVFRGSQHFRTFRIGSEITLLSELPPAPVGANDAGAHPVGYSSAGAKPQGLSISDLNDQSLCLYDPMTWNKDLCGDL